MPFPTPDRQDDLRPGLTAVTMRAAFDRRFRSALMEDPHRAIRDSFGIELPATLRLRFLEKPGDVDLLVVLPDLVDEAPLSHRELDRVPGGAGCLEWHALVVAALT
ncbi:MAG: hypothetical protein JO040_05595 [Gemmatimonadetes bacterium]|nr:hypothetical protein [Gemmatimonadota bacterium]